MYDQNSGLVAVASKRATARERCARSCLAGIDAQATIDYVLPMSADVRLQLHAAPVGEPALGPVAFPHRASARSDPLGTLGRHWQDSTHISFGVLTAGIFTRYASSSIVGLLEES